MEEEKNVMENSSQERKINLKKKKIMLTVAITIILFLGVNVFAATQGYNNIFFAIKNLFEDVSINGKNEILTDKEIIISYNPIELAPGAKVEVNKLTVKNNEALLTLTLRNDENLPFNQKISRVEYGVSKDDLTYTPVFVSESTIVTQDFLLYNYSDDTEYIYITFGASSNFGDRVVGKIKVNLRTKEIEVIESSINSFEKISEVELKNFLSKYVAINKFNDGILTRKNSIEEEVNYQLVKTAMKIICEKEVLDGETQINYTREKVDKVIKEISGITTNVNFEFSSKKDEIMYDKNRSEYIYNELEEYSNGYCLEILDISFKDGVYKVKFVYNYPTDNDWIEGNIEKLQQFETIMYFTLNKDYEYTKYCIRDVYNISSNLYKEAVNEENNSSEIYQENDYYDILEKDEVNEENMNNIFNESEENENLIDKEIIIESTPIEFLPGAKGEINKLTVKNNHVLLTLTLRNDKDLPFNQKISRVEYGVSENDLTYVPVFVSESEIVTQDFLLYNYTNDTEYIYIKFETSTSSGDEVVGKVKVNLETREIEVLD